MLDIIRLFFPITPPARYCEDDMKRQELTTLLTTSGLAAISILANADISGILEDMAEMMK